MFTRWIITAFFILMFSTPSLAAGKDYSVESLFNLPEEKIDIGIAALILSSEIYPGIDIKAYSAKIDKLAGAVRDLVSGSKDPDYRIRALNTVLFRDEGYKYDFSDPYCKNFKNKLICGILERKKGECFTLPLLYLAVAQRCGYPVYAVTVPDHMFLRYVDPNLKQQNIEATNGGQYAPDEVYIEDSKIPVRGIKSGAYLKTMSNRELLGDLIAVNALLLWESNVDLGMVIYYLKQGALMNPVSPGIMQNLGNVYLTCYKFLSLKEGGDYNEAEKYRVLGMSCRQKASDLGFTKLPMEEYVEKIKRKAKEEASNDEGGER